MAVPGVTDVGSATVSVGTRLRKRATFAAYGVEHACVAAAFRRRATRPVIAAVVAVAARTREVRSTLDGPDAHAVLATRRLDGLATTYVSLTVRDASIIGRGFSGTGREPLGRRANGRRGPVLSNVGP